MDKTEVKNAVKLIEDNYMTVSEMQEILKLKSYQYARQFIQTNRYELGNNTIELTGRTLVSRNAVQRALEIRKSKGL
ncbi:hypothetical protein M0R72_16740 [Candidatus Pacearchaeota archaeon]|jgi:hypothetical protein|nr:hypothetical protein [Candidatus Pacearchaeota archaeon]